jgi:type I restriction enzyme S subunit
MPRTSWKDMTEFPFCLPSRSPLEVFESLFSPSIQKIHFASEQNQTLAAIRDALLPRLISGELRVPDAEKMLEEVGI